VVHAVIFDIDGTLIKSDDADTALYVAAVRSILGPVRFRESWARYAHVTDSAILRNICADNDLEPTQSVHDQVRERFVASLAQHIGTFGPFEEIPGAREFVLSLHRSPNHVVGYATGGWRASAELKLASAGFPLDIPLASSDDFADRTSIMTHALSQMGRTFKSIAYYGDGSWDRDATTRLGWRFIAVGEALAGISSFADSSCPESAQADAP
ncbi:MAG: HAD family hydrolase, partial [Steroidobacteraceae bacterium]